MENQSIYIMREAFNKFENLAMLWSIGKDSTVLLWLARKAFFGHVPFPLVHVDTTYKIPSMIEYRDRLVREWKLELVVGKNEEVLDSGHHLSQRQSHARGMLRHVEEGRRSKQVLEKHHFTGVIVGVRRDEEPTRAKERYFSPRDKNMEWNVEDQPPELWDQFKTDFEKGTHIRIHPLLHWTEMNIWEYIERENIPIIPLYFANGKASATAASAARPARCRSNRTRKNGARNHRRTAQHENARTRRPRAGQGKRRRVRETAARRLHVSRPALTRSEQVNMIIANQSNGSVSHRPSEQLKIVIVGHVDHGKSTFVGRLVPRHRLVARGQAGAAAADRGAPRRAVRVGEPDGCAAVRARPEHHHRHRADLVSHRRSASTSSSTRPATRSS